MKKKYITLILLAFIVVSNAQESKITGIWQLSKVVHDGKTETGLKTVFIFAKKGILKAARSANSEWLIVGTWKYNKKHKLIVMKSSMDNDFNGEATLLKVNKNELVYKKEGAVLSFKKITAQKKEAKSKSITITKPKLSFKEEAMLDADGSFSYEDEDKLPWKIDSIVNYLKNDKEIIYTATHFPNDYEPNSFLVGSKIKYNEAEKTLDVREFSYAQNDYIDMTEDPIMLDNLEDYEDDFHFFPEDNLNIYKVVGTENVKTALGNFDCTVVEGFGDFDNKLKYWMINDKPGVYAKIILVKEAPGSFGYTNLYTLKEIK